MLIHLMNLIWEVIIYVDYCFLFHITCFPSFWYVTYVHLCVCVCLQSVCAGSSMCRGQRSKLGVFHSFLSPYFFENLELINFTQLVGQ